MKQVDGAASCVDGKGSSWRCFYLALSFLCLFKRTATWLQFSLKLGGYAELAATTLRVVKMHLHCDGSEQECKTLTLENCIKKLAKLCIVNREFI